MNKKILAFSTFLFSAMVIAFMSSCNKDGVTEPLEPISFIQPDSSIERLFPGDSQAFEIKFTTDRPINWIKGMCDIDSLNQAGYVATYPDTAFFVKLDTLDPRVNLYTYTGTYHVPDSLNPYDVIRFRVSFEAGKTTFTTGQNYPAGIVGAAKEFRIDLR
jgi:hypothetical protein